MCDKSSKFADSPSQLVRLDSCLIIHEFVEGLANDEGINDEDHLFVVPTSREA